MSPLPNNLFSDHLNTIKEFREKLGDRHLTGEQKAEELKKIDSLEDEVKESEITYEQRNKEIEQVKEKLKRINAIQKEMSVLMHQYNSSTQVDEKEIIMQKYRALGAQLTAGAEIEPVAEVIDVKADQIVQSSQEKVELTSETVDVKKKVEPTLSAAINQPTSSLLDLNRPNRFMNQPNRFQTKKS